MHLKLKDTDKIQITSAASIYPIMQRILMRENKIDRNREHFWVLGLDTAHTLLYVEMIALGTVNRVLVEPMEVYSFALQKRSVNIIVVHNHPSGNLNPSEADKQITDKLIQVGEFLNVPVLDSIIISEKSFYSFADSGLLQHLKANPFSRIPYREQQRKLDESQKLGEQEALKKVAREMKLRGIELQVIAELTGLTEDEIKKLKPRKSN